MEKILKKKKIVQTVFRESRQGIYVSALIFFLNEEIKYFFKKKEKLFLLLVTVQGHRTTFFFVSLLFGTRSAAGSYAAALTAKPGACLGLK